MNSFAGPGCAPGPSGYEPDELLLLYPAIIELADDSRSGVLNQ